MKKVQPVFWGGALVVVLFSGVLGCTSVSNQVADVPPEERVAVLRNAALTNRIQVNGHQFVLPSAWEYGPGVREGVALSFRYEDLVSGQLEVFPWDGELSHERVVDYFEERVFPSDSRVERFVLPSSRFGDVTVFHGEHDGRMMLSLITIPYEQRLLSLHISYDPAVAIETAEALKLLERYRYEADRPDYRLGDDRIGFVAVDSSWRWSTDINDGLYARYVGEGLPLAVAIWSADETEVTNLEDSGKEIVVPAIYPQLRGAGAPVQVFEDDDFRWDSYFLVYQRATAAYILKVSHPSSSQRTADTVLADPVIQEFVDFNLVFPEMEVSP